MALELVMLIGLQASGKTTFRRHRFDATHVVVSKDLMPNNRRPSRRQEVLIVAALSEGRSVVVDNTNLRLDDRAALMTLAARFGALVKGYYFPSSVGQALERNARRDGRARVPDVGILAMAKAMCAPSASEGFHELFRVEADLSGTVMVIRQDA